MIGKVTVTVFVAICLVMLIEMGQCNPVIGKKFGNYALFIHFFFVFTFWVAAVIVLLSVLCFLWAFYFRMKSRATHSPIHCHINLFLIPCLVTDSMGSFDFLGVCIRNCAQCKKMYGSYFEGQMCADACVKFKGKMIPGEHWALNDTIRWQIFEWKLTICPSLFSK